MTIQFGPPGKFGNGASHIVRSGTDAVRNTFGDKLKTYREAFCHKSAKRGAFMVKHAVSTVTLVLIVLACGAARAGDAHMMTKEQLLPMLGKPDVIIIDVRTNYDWDKSKVKIKGAVREEGMKFGSWMKKYPKDKTIVLYCA
jgi:predicted sulfurtransferase